MIDHLRMRGGFLLATSALALAGQPVSAQSSSPVAANQPQDAEYGKLIDQYLSDKRFQTDLVDHLPASDTVPTPLKFFGRIPGQPGELEYSGKIEDYYKELARVSPRAKLWVMGKSEEGRDIVVLAIGDEEALKNLDKYKADLAALGDSRKTTPEQARQIISGGKPIYWINSGIHSPETGGPEMLIELAYRLIVEESPLVQNIRNHMITFITPVLEVDGRDKEVDTYYYGKKTGKPRPPLMYWGKYVAHDNNRDGIGQYLKLTQAFQKGILEWHPTVLHDLHEQQSYLYVSTGTGPYNDKLDPIVSNEWWLLAETELMGMNQRKVPGVFTYGYYDGWTPNYLFWMGVTHNTFGRFYEVQSYGPDAQPHLTLPPSATSREWYRPNPPLPEISWSPRNNTNIQESAILLALDKVATDRKLYLENYWLKNKHAVEGGQAPDIKAWVIPAEQRARANVADFVNDLRHQGLEVSTANAAFTAGGVQVQPGDFIIRGDQPYRTVADIYLSVQNYPPANPRSHDDTAWTMQFMRNLDLHTIKDAAILQQPMTLLTTDTKPKGGIAGSGPVILVNATGDNELISLRFRLKAVKFLAAEAPFEANGKKYAAGTFIIPAANRAEVEKELVDLGLSGEAVGAAPSVATHELALPRIGYLHSWQNTQDEGWWRAALDHYGVPYTYFADIKAREGGLRQKYDVIIYPTVGTSTTKAQLEGVPMNGTVPIPYQKTALTPNLGANDSAPDIRGGLGHDGLAELQKFVEAGGTLIADGSTANLLAETGAAKGISVTAPAKMYVQGSLLRGVFKDQTSPITYGYMQDQMPVYFSSTTVLNVERGGGGRGYGPDPAAGIVQNYTPNETPVKLSPYGEDGKNLIGQTKTPAAFNDQPTSRTGGAAQTQFPRVIMSLAPKADELLLSGTLSGGEPLASKPLVIDVPSGLGHYVLFGMRPFWRWETQGSYNFGFNAILNWNHLDAGKK